MPVLLHGAFVEAYINITKDAMPVLLHGAFVRHKSE